MKIAVVVRGFHKSGGISRCAAEIAERLSEMNEVHVLTNYFETKDINLNYHNIKPWKCERLSRFKTAIEFASFALKSYKELRTQEYDIIHSHSSSCIKQDILTAHSCHKASLIKLAELSKNRVNKYDLFRLYINPFNFVNIRIEKLQYQKGNYKKIVALSSSLKEEILKSYEVSSDDIVVIPNGIDLEQFKPNQDFRTKIRKKLDLTDDEFILMFISHRFANKGLEVVIKAISLLKEKKIRLLVFSGDNARHFIELSGKLGLNEQIKFLGPTNNPENFYPAADVVVNPSSYEGFGLVILEAMASGLPVIATNTGCAPDVINNMVDGFYVSIPPDPNEISEIICNLYKDENFRKTVGKNARVKAAQFSWDIIASKTLKLYESIL
jgi:UDP-glucose:(heptosyl)LPS alpha-1,3-glucosyltransferase